MYIIYRRVTQTLTGSNFSPHITERLNTPGCYMSQDATGVSHSKHNKYKMWSFHEIFDNLLQKPHKGEV